jgi:hypothetical protein
MNLQSDGESVGLGRYDAQNGLRGCGFSFPENLE